MFKLYIKGEFETAYTVVGLSDGYPDIASLKADNAFVYTDRHKNLKWEIRQVTERVCESDKGIIRAKEDSDCANCISENVPNRECTQCRYFGL